MDSLLDYLDILEDLVDSSGKTYPFSNKVSVEKERVFDIIRDIRLNLPNEIRQAQRIIEEHEKILNDAKIRAGTILNDAENNARIMTSSHEIHKEASEQASSMLEEARQNSRDMRINAMEYADDMLAKAEGMIREAMINIEQQFRIVDDYFAQTINIIYQNRQELRGIK